MNNKQTREEAEKALDAKYDEIYGAKPTPPVATSKPKPSFVLIEHGDGGPHVLRPFATEEEREDATACAIFGSLDNVEAEPWASYLEKLRQDGSLTFEGDPGLAWMTAFVEPTAATVNGLRELDQLRAERQLCQNSVVEACIRFPNVSMHVLQHETELTALREQLAAVEKENKQLKTVGGATDILRKHVKKDDPGLSVVGAWGAVSEENADLKAQLAATRQRLIEEQAIRGELAEALGAVNELTTQEGWNTPLFQSEFGAAVRSARKALAAHQFAAPKERIKAPLPVGIEDTPENRRKLQAAISAVAAQPPVGEKSHGS